jgi:hypothetical protein
MDSTGILPRYHPSICEKIEKGAKTGRLSAREVCSSLLFRNSSNRSAQMPTSGTSTVYERRKGIKMPVTTILNCARKSLLKKLPEMLRRCLLTQD